MSDGVAGYEFTHLKDSVTMDFRLQHLLARAQHGHVKPATATTGADEVSVVAKVSDLKSFDSLPFVTTGAVVGDTAEDGTTIVTARVPVARLNQLRQHPSVLSLKAAQRLTPTLAQTTAEISARPGDLPAGSGVDGGRGVIVGIVDFGCDFAHLNFRTADGGTRLLCLWDQSSAGAGEGSFSFGTVFHPVDINDALTKPDPYEALGYGPDPSKPAHGTHVMDIAAGNGLGTGTPGVAPASDLIFVELASSDIPWGGKETVGASFGDSVQLLEALAFIFERAGDTPCSVNVSLGTNGGPHDGTTLVEQGVDRLLKQAPNRSVCIAASNSFADGIHAAGEVPVGGSHDIIWRILDGDFTHNELELWYPGTGALDVEILTPAGDSVGLLGPGQSATASDSGKVLLFVANRLHDPNNGDNAIGMFLSPDVPTGDWIIRLHNAQSTVIAYHAWIERDDNGQSSFVQPLDNSHTIGSISCGRKTIVVGSYDAHRSGQPLSGFSSAGPTRDSRDKPEVSAPGHEVLAAKSRSKTGVTRMSGTSMASPAVTGCVALLLAVARARGDDLTVDQIRDLVVSTARANPPAPGVKDPRYGEGRVSAAQMIEKLATP